MRAGRERWKAAGSHGGTGGLLVFGVTLLALLVMTPVGYERAMRPHLNHIDGTLQPAREMVLSIESRLAEEAALARGYLLTRDSAFLDDYRRVQRAQRRSLERLRAIRLALEPSTRTEARRLEGLVARRHEPMAELRRGVVTPEVYAGRLRARQQLLDAALNSTRALAAELAARERSERATVSRLRRFQDRTQMVLAVLAGAAVLAVGRVARRLRLRRRNAEEVALRRVASAMNAALGVDQIARWIAGNALALLGADAVVVERAELLGGEVRIPASAGRVGTLPARVPFSASFSAEQVASGGHRRFERGNVPHLAQGYLDPDDPDAFGVVFRLASDEGLIGALVVLRRPGRAAFSDSEIWMGEMLADLASLAMRKVLLLEQATPEGRMA